MISAENALICVFLSLCGYLFALRCVLLSVAFWCVPVVAFSVSAAVVIYNLLEITAGTVAGYPGKRNRNKTPEPLPQDFPPLPGTVRRISRRCLRLQLLRVSDLIPGR